MRIASITITSDRSAIIGDALRSVVGLVDVMVFVDLGMDEPTKRIIEDIAGSSIHTYYAPENPSASMHVLRNKGLWAAEVAGCDWAIMLDTDERIKIKQDPRPFLEASGADTLSCLHVDGTYTKERFFRLPAKGRFSGHTHEKFSGGTSAFLPCVEFDELPKSEETLTSNLVLMIESNNKQIEAEPEEHRWHHYAALFARGQGHNVEALSHCEKAIKFCKVNTLNAYYHYTKAVCLYELKFFESALAACVHGLQHHPGLAELSWFAGVQCMALGRAQEAMCWANMAIGNGLYVGSSFAQNRLGRREPYALWEGPFELQRDAMRVLGYPEQAIEHQEAVIAEVIKTRQA